MIITAEQNYKELDRWLADKKKVLFVCDSSIRYLDKFNKKLKEIINSNGDTKPVLLFYQDNYSTPKARKPNYKDTESYMVEDLFNSDSYTSVTNKIHVKSYKELRNMTWNDVISSNKRPKGTTEAIKYYIQENYASFGKELLQNFKPVLDKLLDVFNLI